jgi:hypothetical protein
LLRDPDRCRELSVSARQAAERYDWAKIAGKFRDAVIAAAREGSGRGQGTRMSEQEPCVS